MKYKGYELQNLECDILDIMDIYRMFEKHVDLTVGHPCEEELGTTYIRVAIEVDARRARIENLDFNVVGVA